MDTQKWKEEYKKDFFLFLLYLFNLYSEIILRGQKDLPRFIISGCNCNTICYTDDTMLMADSESKHKYLLRKARRKF